MTKDKNCGDLQKKLKKGHCLSVPRFVPFPGPRVEKFCNQVGADLFFFLFFFLEITLIVVAIFTSAPLPPQSSLQNASHRPAFIGDLIEMSKNVVKSVALQ